MGPEGPCGIMAWIPSPLHLSPPGDLLFHKTKCLGLHSPQACVSYSFALMAILLIMTAEQRLNTGIKSCSKERRQVSWFPRAATVKQHSPGNLKQECMPHSSGS